MRRGHFYLQENIYATNNKFYDSLKKKLNKTQVWFDSSEKLFYYSAESDLFEETPTGFPAPLYDVWFTTTNENEEVSVGAVRHEYFLVCVN